MRIIAFLLIFIFMSGCRDATEVMDIPNTEKSFYADESHGNDTFYCLFVENDYTLSLYEPKKGCYLGAYILANKKLNFDIDNFETMVDQEHCTYIYNMKLGEAFPSQWVLECISAMKTPHIIINPPNEYLPFQDFFLEEVSKEFGEFYVPIFVQFYPNPDNFNLPADEYKVFFQKVREAFSRNASNVSFVWSIDSKSVTTGLRYYPGDEYVDWVGLNIYSPVFEGESKNERDIWADIDYFYFEFQKRKPVMISQLAISHYSTYNHMYYQDEAIKKISEFYSNVLRNYPRIKAVYYMDFNNVELSSGITVKDDFSITNDETLKKTYSDAIENDYFLSELSIIDSGSVNGEFFKSPFRCLKRDNQIYISENTIKYDLNIEIPYGSIERSIVKNGEHYYPLEGFDAFSGSKLYFDDDNMNCYIYMK